MKFKVRAYCDNVYVRGIDDCTSEEEADLKARDLLAEGVYEKVEAPDKKVIYPITRVEIISTF